LLDLKPEQVLAVGKYKKTVAARSLLCFWATSELGISQSELGQKLKISQPAVSLVIFVVPIIGVVFQQWRIHDWLFLSACIVSLVFIFLAVRALREYGRPQEYMVNSGCKCTT
jgi:hypothetical protein